MTAKDAEREGEEGEGVKIANCGHHQLITI
jgi:hypothetical protein